MEQRIGVTSHEGKNYLVQYTGLNRVTRVFGHPVLKPEWSDAVKHVTSGDDRFHYHPIESARATEIMEELNRGRKLKGGAIPTLPLILPAGGILRLGSGKTDLKLRPSTEPSKEDLFRIAAKAKELRKKP